MGDMRENFRQKAEELAQLEAQMLEDASYADDSENPVAVSGETANATPILIWLALAVVGFIGCRLAGAKIPEFVPYIVAAVCVYKAYMSFQSYRLDRESDKSARQGKARLEPLRKKREKLLQELNQMRQADSGLQGEYWWDMGVSPLQFLCYSGERLLGWDFQLMPQINFREKNGKIYCDDYTENGYTMTPEQARSFARKESLCELYRDEDVLSSGCTVYEIRQLNASHIEPIEEVATHTTRTYHDKKSDMEKFRRNLDQYERSFNLMYNGQYESNEEAHLMGRVSDQDWLSDSLFRDAVEDRYERKLDQRGEYDEDVRYSSVFRGLYCLEFLTCAWVLSAADGPLKGQIAYILLPLEEQKSIRFTMRADKKEKPCSGYLESYAGFDPLVYGWSNIRPSIQNAADILFHGENRTRLGLKKRDVLMPKPKGLESMEWCYLIWRDRT